jgi:hypothetical protein
LTKAASNLEIVEETLTPEQIAEGQRLSREWREKHGGAEKEGIQ